MARTERFTRDGSVGLEMHLSQTCRQALAEVQACVPPQKLEALVLGGGYGRGEGGVLQTRSGDRPYNDLEFYVFLSGNRVLNERRYHEPLAAVGERLSPSAGLHVEFKVDSLERLRQSPPTLFTYDLISGHKILFGPDNVFDGCEHHGDPRSVPLHEATRLLFNRCTGLLLARERLRKSRLTSEDTDFIGRNIAKAKLAFGDAILIAIGEYHWSCVERHVRLQRAVAHIANENRASQNLEDRALPDCANELLPHHADGVEFKLHPRQSILARDALEREHATITALGQRVWLWIENHRLGRAFSDIREYAFSSEIKTPDHHAWRSMLLNLRTFGPRSLGDRMAFRYPRERLLNALPLLLWEQPLNDATTRRHLQYHLRTRASDWQSLLAAYKSVWPAFS